jgi:segregation and condensation protein A
LQPIGVAARAQAGVMSYEVKLEVFEGPLDLLLHLIHKNEVSITDIPIALITSQYLETIELMKSLNLDVAGEYLMMAAYLTHIKSEMLLPGENRPDSPEETGKDPRNELVAHLLEYKRFKESAEQLGSCRMLDRDIFLREPAEELEDQTKSRQPLEVSVADLVAAFKSIIDRTAKSDLLELEPERLLVRDKMTEILQQLTENDSATFESLFDGNSSRLNVLTCFLALLELIKLQLVRVYQAVPFGPILARRTATERDYSFPH